MPEKEIVSAAYRIGNANLPLDYILLSVEIDMTIVPFAFKRNWTLD